MSTQVQGSADGFLQHFDQVKNPAGLTRLKCKRCDLVFDGYAPHVFKSHLRDFHPDLDVFSRTQLTVSLREESIRQLKRKPGGVFASHARHFFRI